MKRKGMYLAVAAIAALTSLGVAGCGISGSGASDTDVLPATTPATTAISSPAATPRTGAAIVQGQVTVTLDKLVYGPTDAITVYVNNGLDTSIAVANHQSACTIVTLQQSLGAAWQTVGACRLMTPTGLMTIAAGTTTVVQLGASAGQFTRSPWPAGTYRIALTYASPPPGGSSPVYSAQFQIQ